MVGVVGRRGLEGLTPVMEYCVGEREALVVLQLVDWNH